MEKLIRKYKENLKNLKEFQSCIEEEFQKIKTEKEQIQQEKKELEVLNEKMSKISNSVKKKVKLNVGGAIFTTLVDTLVLEKGTFFSAMFSEEFNQQPDEDGEYFIDRDPCHFPMILNYFRKGKLDTSGLSSKELQDLIDEVEFYQIGSLLKELKNDNVVSNQISVLSSSTNCTIDTLSSKQLRICKNLSNTGWNCGVLLSKASQWRVNLEANCSNLMIGVAPPSKFDTNGTNYNVSGWYVHCLSGRKYSGSGDNDTTYTAALCAVGTFIVVTYTNQQLSLSVNGIEKGVAYSSLPLDLVPAFDIYDKNCKFTVEIIS